MHPCMLDYRLCIQCHHGVPLCAFTVAFLLCSVLELDDNEAAISLCLVQFSSMPEDELLLAVGTVQGLTFYPRQVDGEQLSLQIIFNMYVGWGEIQKFSRLRASGLPRVHDGLFQ